jgi:drug/metabolite transporter (DMT)-like permease
MSQQVLLILASIAVGFTYILNKRITDIKYSATSYTALRSLTSAVVALPLLFIHPHFSLSPFYWLIVGISISVYGLSVFFSFKAYQQTDASVVSIVHKTSVVISAFLGIILLRESYSLVRYFGLFLITTSGMLLAYNKKRFSITTGMLFAFLMAVTSGVAGYLDKIILNDFSPYTYAFINPFLIFLLFARKRSTWIEMKKIVYKHPINIIVNAFLAVGSWLIFLIVLQQTNVSQTLPIYKSLSYVTPVVFGILLLGEQSQLLQKILGVIIGIAGIFFLYR